MNTSRSTRSPRPVMTPVVADLEPLMGANSRAHSREDGSSETTEVCRAHADQEHNHETLADHVVSEEQLAEEERPMYAGRTVTVS